MRVSYNWLQDNFEDKLPSPEEIRERLVMHSFEVESLEEIDVFNEKDYIYDVKVLPNRAHDCNSHLGVAREVAVLFGLALKGERPLNFTESAILQGPVVLLENNDLCPRYIGRIIRNIKVGESPFWLKRHLASIGQRSINNIVDAANYVMFQTGQPLHIFDLDKTSPEIRVRSAIPGERMTTLDNKELILDPSMLVIADKNGALALAGIKGGTRAATDNGTTNIILESANFTASPIRRSSQKTGIRTDASYRFEHELSPEMAGQGMEDLTRLIVEVAGSPEVEVSTITDVYLKPTEIREISFTSKDVESVLGIAMKSSEVEDILDRFKRHAGFNWKKDGDVYMVTPSPVRLDLTPSDRPYGRGIKEDLIEELGRVNGYEKIPFTPLEVVAPGPVNKLLYFIEIVRDLMISQGFSEVYNYTFVGAGESAGPIELRNPLTEDKKYLRNNLYEVLVKRVSFNLMNADILGADQIRIFEIGRVFPFDDVSGERVHCAFAITSQTKKFDLAGEMNKMVDLLKEKISNPNISFDLNIERGYCEFDLEDAIRDLNVPAQYAEFYDSPEAVFYKPISPFPFITRDIAVFVPEEFSDSDLLNIIKENAGGLLVKTKLFDQFTKTFEDGSRKVSYAFRLVFQSPDRTLTGEEISAIMDKITNVLNGKEGWRVR